MRDFAVHLRIVVHPSPTPSQAGGMCTPFPFPAVTTENLLTQGPVMSPAGGTVTPGWEAPDWKLVSDTDKNQTMKGVMYKESAVQMIVEFSILIPEIQKQYSNLFIFWGKKDI